tara:strand:+ start:267 stop:533 length:267 start_codon:yes stop_codon:yes gene_type:complete
MKYNSLSKLFVGEDGKLRCGHPEKETSIVGGGRIKLDLDKDNEILVDVVFINEIGVKCNGYLFSCPNEFYQKVQLKRWNEYENKKRKF